MYQRPGPNLEAGLTLTGASSSGVLLSRVCPCSKKRNCLKLMDRCCCYCTAGPTGGRIRHPPKYHLLHLFRWLWNLKASILLSTECPISPSSTVALFSLIAEIIGPPAQSLGLKLRGFRTTYFTFGQALHLSSACAGTNCQAMNATENLDKSVWR